MKKSSKIIVAVVLGVGIISGVTAYAHRSGHDHVGFMVERVSDKLELDTEQTAKLQELVVDMRALHGELSEDRKTTKQELLELIAMPQLDQARVVSIVQAKTEMVDANIGSVVASIATFTDSLDGEQKAELVDMLEWRIGHRGRH